jgi:hypothetical protein
MQLTARTLIPTRGTLLAIGAGLMLSGGLLKAQYTVVDISPVPNGRSYSVHGGTAAQQVGTLRVDPFGLNHALLLSANGTTVVDLHPTTLTPDSPYFDVPGAVVNTPSTAYASDGVSQVGSFINTAVMWTGTADSMLNLHPPGYSHSCATAVNGAQQAGWATTAVSGGGRRGVQTSFDVPHAILWRGGSTNFVDLHPASFLGSGATSLSSNGFQAGYGLNNNNQSQAVIWAGSAASAINLHPQPFTTSVANGVNVNGWAAGTGTIVKSGKAITSINHAVLWFGSASKFVDLHPAGFTDSYGLAIDSNKQVGFGTLADATGTHSHALLWTNSAASVVDLNKFLPAGFTDAFAVAIDLNGNIIGNASGADGREHQVLWIAQ